jgi:hypothetical protein
VWIQPTDVFSVHLRASTVHAEVAVVEQIAKCRPRDNRAPLDLTQQPAVQLCVPFLRVDQLDDAAAEAAAPTLRQKRISAGNLPFQAAHCSSVHGRTEASGDTRAESRERFVARYAADRRCAPGFACCKPARKQRRTRNHTSTGHAIPPNSAERGQRANGELHLAAAGALLCLVQRRF